MTLVACKIWTGSKTGGLGRQYGQVSGGTVHRKAYTDMHGPIPKGMQVLHSCDNPLCYEVTHLRLGTAKDNALDKAVRGRDCRKLSIKQVHEIRASKETQMVLGTRFGVSHVLIGLIKSGKRRQFV